MIDRVSPIDFCRHLLHVRVQLDLLAVDRFRYASQTHFHYVPPKILDRTRSSVSAEVLHYHAKTSCQPSFVQLINVTIDPMPIDFDSTQLTREIQKIFDDADVGGEIEEIRRFSQFRFSTENSSALRRTNVERNSAWQSN